MAECFRCGITGDRVRLFDAISSDGIVKICEKCSKEEDIPIIKKPSFFGKKPELFKQERYLRELIDSKIPVKENEKIDYPDLIRNFHWIIMRGRRLRHLTQEQLGKEVGESEKIIKLAEKGILKKDYQEFIKKIENRLGIRIFTQEIREKMEQQRTSLGFDPVTTKTLTISDLQDMRRKKESEILDEREEMKGYIPNKNNKETEEKEDISKEEIDRILFRK